MKPSVLNLMKVDRVAYLAHLQTHRPVLAGIRLLTFVDQLTIPLMIIMSIFILNEMFNGFRFYCCVLRQFIICVWSWYSSPFRYVFFIIIIFLLVIKAVALIQIGIKLAVICH